MLFSLANQENPVACNHRIATLYCSCCRIQAFSILHYDSRKKIIMAKKNEKNETIDIDALLGQAVAGKRARLGDSFGEYASAVREAIGREGKLRDRIVYMYDTEPVTIDWAADFARRHEQPARKLGRRVYPHYVRNEEGAVTCLILDVSVPVSRRTVSTPLPGSTASPGTPVERQAMSTVPAAARGRKI